ncbi:MAG: hypothetical protein DRQ47_07480 [Gammaproteobacteria bacterium]|nr:MAG: hypothetical protein DRQ47_07480 [Gammaproteobacteria bacterium]
MSIKIPYGAIDEYGCWYPNPHLMMPTVDQYIHNVNMGFNMNHECKTPTGVVREMKLVFLLGCARDMNPRGSYYRGQLAKAKIRSQPFY